jgi:hypothetical protein
LRYHQLRRQLVVHRAVVSRQELKTNSAFRGIICCAANSSVSSAACPADGICDIPRNLTLIWLRLPAHRHPHPARQWGAHHRRAYDPPPVLRPPSDRQPCDRPLGETTHVPDRHPAILECTHMQCFSFLRIDQISSDLLPLARQIYNC